MYNRNFKILLFIFLLNESKLNLKKIFYILFYKLSRGGGRSRWHVAHAENLRDKPSHVTSRCHDH